MQLFNAPRLASIVFFSYAQASYLHNDLSFGQSDRISPNLRGVPNWHISGTPSVPEILSNKLILTAPAPGNQRGAVWSDKVLEHSEWTADIDFRATGPDRGGGNMQIWYVKDGKKEVGTSSVYTVGKFDGLVIVVDQYASSGGYIRGFLNDGSSDYKNHHSVDSLAFGHCQYSYRNLGRPSRIAIKQMANSFQLTVDGNSCFESSKIKLPLGYNFGITAASTPNPDSFEIFKFVTTTETHAPDGSSSQQEAPQKKDPPHEAAQSNTSPNKGDIPSFSEPDPPEEDASKFTSSASQFADIHNRLQLMMKHISTAHRDNIAFHTDQQADTRAMHDDYTSVAHKIELLSTNVQNILNHQQGLEKKLDSLVADTKTMKSELHNSLERHTASVRTEVRSSHEGVIQSVGQKGQGLGWGSLLVVVVGGQVASVGAYVLYKRRRGRSHMKYM